MLALQVVAFQCATMLTIKRGFLKKIYLFERKKKLYIYSEGQTHTDLLVTSAPPSGCSGQGWGRRSWKPGNPSWSPTKVAVLLGPSSSTFPGTLAGNRIESGVVGT